MPDTVKYRFTRRDRLTKTDEFSSVFGFRKAIRGQWLMLHYQPRHLQRCSQHGWQNPDPASSPIVPDATMQTARLGLVVGKKLLKRAVDRNRLKRVVRESFRLRCAELPSYDLIVRLTVKGVPLYAGPPAEGQLCLKDDINALFDRLVSRHQRHATKVETTAETTTATAAYPT